MQNGCICCTLQSDLVDQIIKLTEMKRFNYILIEASGVSEPHEIAPLFDIEEPHEVRYLNDISNSINSRNLSFVLSSTFETTGDYPPRMRLRIHFTVYYPRKRCISDRLALLALGQGLHQLPAQGCACCIPLPLPDAPPAHGK